MSKRNFYAIVRRRDLSRFHAATIRASDATQARELFDANMKDYRGFNTLIIDHISAADINPAAPLLLLITKGKLASSPA